MRQVEPIRTEGDVTALGKGLAAGEVVVTDGVDKLQQNTGVVVGQPNAPHAGEGAAPGGAGEKGGKGGQGRKRG
jgi:hypothetical protein